ncbi:MAG TPA: dihydrofolate reductase family protein [Pyrinomonadaceae bacterium]|nr:dihydrofolate reductase family protein [Pyrinomonadaceae bacterium]
MRKVVFGGANSLDNYFARNDDSVDWLMWSDEVTEFLADYWKRFDTIVMGRRTYEVSLQMGGGGAYPGVKSYVFSKTVKTTPAPGVELISQDVAEFVRKLKSQEGKDICVMGGGLLARSLFQADLIDEVGFNIHPVLLGSGIPIFHEIDHQIDLELLDCKTLKNGCVLVTYRVKPPGEKRKKVAKKALNRKKSGKAKIGAKSSKAKSTGKTTKRTRK